MDLKKPSLADRVIFYAGQAFGWALQALAGIALLALFGGLAIWSIRFFLNSILT